MKNKQDLHEENTKNTSEEHKIRANVKAPQLFIQ